jgi:hypothetical protein
VIAAFLPRTAQEAKEMTTEQAKTLSESAVARLVEALDKGESAALKAYLGAMSRFHKYSWSNCLLIHSQRPNPLLEAYESQLNIPGHLRDIHVQA